MRTNIVIDDKLMASTLKATGVKTEREVLELGLRTLRRLKHQTELRKLPGKYAWEGDLGAIARIIRQTATLHAAGGKIRRVSSAFLRRCIDV